MTVEPRSEVPFYVPAGNEVAAFRAAAARGLPIMLKGPTGCGKTRFVEHMAEALGRPLHTVSCHEDMTGADLLGRYVLDGDATRWLDGPLTRAAREGGICYLDEVVEARQDATVAVHSLADHRRELHLERRGGERIHAAPGFLLVVSYNPGYQSILKDLKPSTRQRMVAIELGFPPAEVEVEVVMREAGVGRMVAEALVDAGRAIRRVEGSGLREVASTRALITAAHLVGEGLGVREAADVGIVQPLTDDREVAAGLAEIVAAYLERSE